MEMSSTVRGLIQDNVIKSRLEPKFEEFKKEFDKAVYAWLDSFYTEEEKKFLDSAPEGAFYQGSKIVVDGFFSNAPEIFIKNGWLSYNRVYLEKPFKLFFKHLRDLECGYATDGVIHLTIEDSDMVHFRSALGCMDSILKTYKGLLITLDKIFDSVLTTEVLVEKYPNIRTHVPLSLLPNFFENSVEG